MPAGNEAGERSTDARPSAIVAGAWAGLLLAAGRIAVLWAMEVLAHGGVPAFVASRLASAAPEIVALALVAALLGAILLARVDGLRLVRWGARAGVALLFAGVLLGWGGDPSLCVEHKTPAGVGATAVVAVGALLLMLGLRAFRPVPGGVGLPLGLALAGTLALRWAVPAVEARHEVRQVARTLFTDTAWEVLDAHPEAPPRPGVVCPSPLPARDAADLQALILAPPARVRLRLEEDGRRGWLRARAGVDQAAWREHGAALEGLAVSFRVTLDGRVVCELRVPLDEDMEWGDLDEGGIPLLGARELELSTRLVSSNGAEVEPPGPIAAGLGDLVIETRRQQRRARSSTEAPNIVLIVLDTLRADRTSAYGYERETTPHLRDLAGRGLAFDEAYATSSWTWPSTASILTGLQPQVHGVTDKRSCFLPYALDTLPEALQRAGFSTAGWSANPLINADKNFDQGFELFDADNRGGLRRSDALVPAALDWMERMASWRFFLYLHLVDPHAPLSPLPEARRRFASDVPADFDPRAITEYGARLLEGEVDVPPEHRRWISELYDACVWSGDHWVGRVLERLEDLDLAERTVVVVTSDHGEELFDHGLATHGHSLFGELTRVPLVLAGPGIPRGARSDEPVSNRHLAATLARIAGAELELGEATNDLLQLAAEPVLFSTSAGWWDGAHPVTLLGMRAGSKVVHFAPEMGSPARLYDLEADPGERHDLAEERAEDARRLRTRAEDLARELAERRRSPRIEAGEATLERLRRLGYVGDQR